MKDQKAQFLKTSGKILSEESITQAMKDKRSIPSVVSMPKRAADVDVADLEEEIRPSSKKKKQKHSK